MDLWWGQHLGSLRDCHLEPHWGLKLVQCWANHWG